MTLDELFYLLLSAFSLTHRHSVEHVIYTCWLYSMERMIAVVTVIANIYLLDYQVKLYKYDG